jgi:ribA/ribD-fused uncharacterized protein
MSSKTASASPSASSDLTALTKAIQALVEQQAANNKLVTAVLERLASAKAPSASASASASASTPASAGPAAEPVKGKRGRKPKAEKEPKTKAAPPAAADGVVRFGSASEGDYKEFSSFFKSPFTVDGKEYRSVANFFHSQKFAGSDDAFAEDIRAQANPALTRAKASSKDHMPREDWDTEKTRIMRSGLLAKFSASSALRRKLLATGDAPIESTLEEEMRVKGFWDIGADGAGDNYMGQILMSVRSELASRDYEDDEEEAPAAAPKAKAPAAAKAAPKKVTPPPPADADSDSDDSEDEEEAPKPKAPVKVTKAVAPAPAPAPAPKPVAKPAAPAEDSDDDESEEED